MTATTVGRMDWRRLDLEHGVQEGIYGLDDEDLRQGKNVNEDVMRM